MNTTRTATNVPGYKAILALIFAVGTHLLTDDIIDLPEVWVNVLTAVMAGLGAYLAPPQPTVATVPETRGGAKWESDVHP